MLKKRVAEEVKEEEKVEEVAEEETNKIEEGGEEDSGEGNAAVGFTELTKEILIEAVKMLNSSVYEDEEADNVKPLVENKVKYVARKEEDIKKDFINACNSIPETLEEFVPDLVTDVYNAIAEEMKANMAEQENETEGKSKKEKNPKKEKKEKVEGEKRKSNLPVKEKDEFGKTVGSMSSALNTLLVKGVKKEDMIKVLTGEFGRSKEKAESKIKSRIKHLTKDGHTVTENDGFFKLTKKA